MGEDEAQQVKVPGQQLHRYIEVGLGSPTARLLGQRTQSEAVLANQWWHMDTMPCNLKETQVMKGSWDSTCPAGLSAREMFCIGTVRVKCLVHPRN